MSKDCKNSIEEYFKQQSKIKKQLNNLINECPDYVMKYLLEPESRTRVYKLSMCELGDKFDKKRHVEFLHMYNCESLKKII